MESVDDINRFPNVTIRHRAVFFDVLCEHSPPGTLPGESAEGVLRVKCWVNRIAAYDPEEAGRKAERFLTDTRGVRSIVVRRWRYSNRRQQKGVKSDGTLFT